MFGFVIFNIRREVFDGCSLRKAVFVFDVREGGKGSVNIMWEVFLMESV